jgi:hypothetical protein
VSVNNPDCASKNRSPDDLLTAALHYRRRGWSVVPVHGKKGRFAWKQFQKQAASPALVRDWFCGRFDGITGVGVICGPVSGGLTCRDFDDAGAYRSWADSHPDLAATLPTAQTLRGCHVYFVSDAKAITPLGDGELRGKGLCLAPPSRHPSGTVYQWLIPPPEGALPRLAPAEVGLATQQAQQTQQNTAGTTTLLVSAVLQDGVVQSAIAATQPTGPGQRNRRLFDLARRLNAIPALASAELSALRPIVAEWHRQALPAITTKGFTESWGDFVVTWGRVRTAADEGAVEAAFKRAVAGEPPAMAAALYDEPRVLLLTSLCRELQRGVGEGPFFLDCRTAGRQVGCNHTTAWRLLSVVFVADGILKPGEKGTRGTQGTRLANEYRYVGD